MGVGQQSARNLLVGLRHLNASRNARRRSYLRRRFIALSPRFRLGVLIPWEAMQKAITPRTRLIPVCHLYLTRQILPVRATVDYARSRGSKLLVDEAFGLSNMKADIQQLESDLYAASSRNCGGGRRETRILHAAPEHVPSSPALRSFHHRAPWKRRRKRIHTGVRRPQHAQV